MKRILSILLAINLCHIVMAQVYPAQSVLATGQWYKMAIDREGMYRIGTEQVPALSGIELSKVAIYGQTGGMLDETNRATDINDLMPIPVWVSDANSNGRFDAGDYLIFYAEASSVWRYNATTQRFNYQRHAYANENYYYLTLDASNATHIDSITTTAATGTKVSNYTAVAIHDNDLVNANASGRIYVGEKFSAAVSSRTITMTMPASTDGKVYCRYAFANVNAPQTSVRLSLAQQNDNHVLPHEMNYYEFDKVFDASTTSLNFTLTFSATATQAAGYLDFIELNANASLSHSSGQQVFRFTPADEDVFYSMTCPADMRMWDISDNYNAHEIIPLRNGNDARFELSEGSAHTIVAFNGGLLTPKSVECLANQNLHNLSDIDYVIVAHKDYIRQAERLADLHRIDDMMTVAVVTDEQVYNEFSAGKQDPMAIRAMMRMLWNRAESDASLRHPHHLLLFGKGTYDNRNIERRNETTVVTYETANSFHETNSYASDDPFCYLENGESGTRDESMDISAGRLPARNSDEATHLVDKIIGYAHRNDMESDDIRGDWRTYVALLADDADPSSGGDSLFTHSAEDLANTIKTSHPLINIDRIYADAYVQQSGAIGSYYPDVNNALKKRMDYGCLLLNYIGHGSMQYIGTERYISLSDISGYRNHRQLTFLVTSTCTYGKYDVPGETCGSEYMLMADGGAVGCISAARPIHHIERFNTDLCNTILTRGMTVGEALRQAKNRTSVSPSISLLGDPALQLSLPMDNVVVTAINQREVGTDHTDTATALSQVTIAGEVQDEAGQRVADFDGHLYATVFDREVETQTLANDNEGTEVRFHQQKNILYKGVAEVSEGRFEYTFTVPRDIEFTYAAGRLSHYARSGADDAAGSFADLYFGGFDTTASFEACRPQIRLFLNDTNFRNGGTTDESPILYAILTDSVGINAVGSGLGHDITAIIDGKGSTVSVLNDFYEQDITDSRGGSLRYELANLSEGYHTLTLKAWNIYNYSNSSTIRFYVRRHSESAIGLFCGYPNPARHSTQLRIEHNIPNRVATVEINIYNHRGQLVRTFKPAVAEGSYVVGPIRWDFTNAAGIPLPNGIYVAHLRLTTTDGEEMSETSKIVKIQ